jgi:hypothetical protein
MKDGAPGLIIVVPDWAYVTLLPAMFIAFVVDGLIRPKD